MGNKLCKKKVDTVDNANPKAPTPFDRIINRLHLRPSSWKSDSHLNQKQINRSDKNSTNENEKSNIIRCQPLSKSSDWTEVDLEVPDKEEHVHLRNPKLSLIFNDENGTPTPPPRKHKTNFREKIEAVAKTGLQAFQQKKPEKPVEEQLCVKKKINYGCPLCDEDERTHNRDHHHHHNHSHNHENVDNNKNIRDNKGTPLKVSDKKSNKETKRKKNLSVISLPNYNELKLTVANFDDIDKNTDADKSNNSIVSLPETKKPTGSTGKLDNYITRCRSFGSLLPQQLKKLRTRKAPADIESDDSFGGLEDWDLGLIEHYNPKDTSLPRPRKMQRNSKDLMSEIESLVVKEEEIEKPKPPVRRAESLVKKINREGSESAHKRSSEILSKARNDAVISKSPTPPPSPTEKPQEKMFPSNLPTEEDGKVEHSSLMRILEQFSIRDKQNAVTETENPLEVNDIFKTDNISVKNSSNQSSLTPSLLEFEKNIAVNSIEEFIHAEKANTEKELSFVKFNTTTVS